MKEEKTNELAGPAEDTFREWPRGHAKRMCVVALGSLVVFWGIGELAYRQFNQVDDRPATWDDISRAFCSICMGNWPVGSGVLVCRCFPRMTPERQVFLMTARHVAQHASVSNSLSVIFAQGSVDNPLRTAQVCTLQNCAWSAPLTGADMAVVNITHLWRDMKTRQPDIGYIDIDSPFFGGDDPDAVHGVTAIRQSDFAREGIGLGTDVWFFGTSQEYWISNLLRTDQPMVMRKGHIAWRNGSLRPADTNQAEVVCFEGTVQPGNSGGPVFVKVNRNGRQYPALVGLVKAILGTRELVPENRPPTRAEMQRLITMQSRLSVASPLDDWLDYMNKMYAGIQRRQEEIARERNPKIDELTNLAWMIGSMFIWLAYLALLASGVIKACIALCKTSQSTLNLCKEITLALIIGGAASYSIIREIRWMQINGFVYHYSLLQVAGNFILCVFSIAFAMSLFDIHKHDRQTCSSPEAKRLDIASSDELADERLNDDKDN